MIRTFKVKHPVSVEVVTDYDETAGQPVTKQVAFEAGQLVQGDVFGEGDECLSVQFGSGDICLSLPADAVEEVQATDQALFDSARFKALAQKFHDAGYGNVGIERKDVEALGIDVKIYDKHRGPENWCKFCHEVYGALLGSECPPSHAMGRGFRCQHYGNAVADAIRQKFCGKAVAS